MALIRTLGVLVTRALRRANKEPDPSVEPFEAKALVSEKYAELHAIVSETGAAYFQTEADIAANGSTGYALPEGHFATLGVDFRIDSVDRRRRLHRLAPQERSDLRGLTGEALYYALEGSSILLYPRPPSGTYKHRYIPQPTDYSFSADSTQIDVISIYGEKFIVWGAAADLLHKGESNQNRAVAERDAAAAKLLEWAVGRVVEEGQPRHVSEDEFRHGRRRSPASFRMSST
jgi:hypothetical protein